MIETKKLMEDVCSFGSNVICHCVSTFYFKPCIFMQQADLKVPPYIGYRDFPGRIEPAFDTAVVFKDFGLPLVTSKKPFAICGVESRRRSMRG